MEQVFTSLNNTILVAYLAGMLVVGIIFARKQKTTTDFFLAGRSMPWIAVGMSMFASLTSAVTYIGVPGIAFSDNVSLVVFCIVSPLIAPVLIKFFYPFYRKINATTSYEYIEKRFGLPARFAISGLFILARMGWLGTVVYAPALALSVMSGMPLWTSIIMMGLISTAYTVLGGLAADIWTDVIQYIFMIAGAVWVAIALATGVPGGIGGIFHQAAVSGHLTIFKWPLSLFQMSALVVAVSFFFQLLYDYGTDQVTVQRLLSIRSNKGTTRAIVFNACTDFFCIGLLLFVGLGLFAFYASNPGSIPQGLSPDRVLPHFIIHELPNGVSGLLIAAILAAAMSSMDSGINSIATVIMIDFLKPLNSYPATEKSGVMLARVLTLVLGAVSTLVAFYVSTIGRIIEAFYTFMGLFSGPVLALFILGIFTKRGSFPGWICGAVMSLGASWWFQNVLKAHWSYFFPVSFLVALTIGYIASVLMPRKGLDESLTVWEKKR